MYIHIYIYIYIFIGPQRFPRGAFFGRSPSRRGPHEEPGVTLCRRPSTSLGEHSAAFGPEVFLRHVWCALS